VDGFGDGLAVCGVVEAVGLIVGVAGTVADADGPDGSDVDDDGADGAVDEASGLACAPRELPALDRLDPHEYTISRMIRSNPPSTIARRRQ
jgi:hypothetical protein